MSSQHPNISLSDWERFRKYSSPFVYRDIINRGVGHIKWYLIPRSHGVAVPSEYLLRLSGYVGPRIGGRRGYKFNYIENAGAYTVMIYSILERDLWIIERRDKVANIREILVVSFGWTPLATTHFRAALCIGRYAIGNHISGVKWAPSN